MHEELKAYLRTKPTLALVGASKRSEKYGNIILRNMLGKGFTVMPINSSESEIEGQTSYPNLKAARAAACIGLVVYVVPPPRTLNSLKEARDLGLKKVWLQPGAGDESTLAYLRDNGFEFLQNECVMVES
ncbi:MAG: CoA-binding protein [Leptospirales bacterium]|jgi:predicted CoA-binding protein